MKKILILAATLALFSGCATSQKNSKACGSGEVFETCGMALFDNAAAAGTYEARVLCDGCKEGSKSILAINADGSFKMETIYEKKIAQRELQSGKYEINGKILTATNQYREKINFEFDGTNLRQIGKNDGFIKEETPLKRLYRPLESR